MEIKKAIIPKNQTIAKLDQPHELNLEAICVFTAIGFFLDKDSYWKDETILAPASINTLNSRGICTDSRSWFDWHYSPRDISFKQATEEFANLFETIIEEQTNNQRVILPLSGGLDSRTQAAAFKNCNADVFSYSYSFKNGYNEAAIAKEVAKVMNFKFQEFEIAQGYLWSQLDTLFNLTEGYANFTSPRQMAFIDNYKTMGDSFSLGHWGDVLFDSSNLPKLSRKDEVDVIINKIQKTGGQEFASALWDAWGLAGNFNSYFRSRIESLLDTIKIEDINAKVRAFKSKYWAPRWTSINLKVFSSIKPINVPYYDDRICKFICSVPENYLKNRQLQIAYIKMKAPELAKITWQDQRPFNLYNYSNNRIPYSLPYKIKNKLKRQVRLLGGRPYVQRNWELQFLGDLNQSYMKMYLLESSLKDWIPETLIFKYFNNFYNEDSLQNAHILNTLLVLSKFNQKQHHA